MPNMQNAAYANTVHSAIAGATNRLNFANDTVNNINSSVAYAENLDADTATGYAAELIVAQAKVTGIQAEIAALNAIT